MLESIMVIGTWSYYFSWSNHYFTLLDTELYWHRKPYRIVKTPSLVPYQDEPTFNFSLIIAERNMGQRLWTSNLYRYRILSLGLYEKT